MKGEVQDGTENEGGFQRSGRASEGNGSHGALRDAVALISDPTQERRHTPLKPGPGEAVLSISRGALQRSPAIH